MSGCERTCRPDESGSAAVELALVLPVLVMLIFGIIYFGRGYNARIELTAAVREGARALALGESVTQSEQAVLAAAATLSSSSIVFSPAPTACAGSGSGSASVTATYAMPYDIPLVTSGTWNLTATGVMRCGA